MKIDQIFICRLYDIVKRLNISTDIYIYYKNKFKVLEKLKSEIGEWGFSNLINH